jgi:hypothetical protein
MRYLIGCLTLAVAAMSITGGVSDRSSRDHVIIRSGDVTARADPDTSFGQYYTISYVIPADLTADRLDQALLEVYVDVAAKTRNEYVNEAPILEVYALTAPFAGSVEYERLESHSRVARPVSLGMRKRVVLDITGIIRAQAAGELVNNGIVLGTVTGSRDGDFRLVEGVLGAGVVGRVRLYEERS